MQITIDVNDTKVADRILETLSQYKKKGIIKITKSNHTEAQDEKFSKIEGISTPKSGSLAATFKNILGEYAKERSTVSMGEDRKLLQEALWEKYGQ